MSRRNFIKGMAVAVVGISVPFATVSASTSVDEWFQCQERLNTFTEADTLSERLDKLNTLMGTDYKLRAYYPKEWETAEWNKPGPNQYSESYFLAATSERLDHSPRPEWKWGVYLERNGKRWTGNMNPLEFLHWTAQVGLGYRLAKAQGA